MSRLGYHDERPVFSLDGERAEKILLAGLVVVGLVQAPFALLRAARAHRRLTLERLLRPLNEVGG